MREIPVEARPLEGFARLLGDAYGTFTSQLAATRRVLARRSIWNVNSSASGGGVAEMLGSLLGYANGAGAEARWLVLDGDEGFFAVTKRIHNRLHGDAGDGGELGVDERRTYESAIEAEAGDLTERIRPGDVAILHDPQTAGLAEAAAAAGAVVVWRCHVGVDRPNDLVRSAWEFLLPYVTQSDAQVFSRREYAWDGLDDRVAVVAPSIDAFSAKNRDLDEGTAAAILDAAGVVPGGDGRDAPPAEFVRSDGGRARIERRATMVEEDPVPPGAPVVLQVSRWDGLKDPVGVLRGFARHVAPADGSHLILAGPAASSVDDDPEGGAVLAEVRAAREELAPGERARVHLACLPMDDEDENAAMVNALQRRADVVVQKSMAEGFGLTVAEAMWKSRPVVASRVGGIQDQVVHGATGLLVDDPADLRGFGDAVVAVLADRDGAARMGERAHARVCEEFLAPRQLLQFARLLERLVA